jgi:hypothetical protein
MGARLLRTAGRRPRVLAGVVVVAASAAAYLLLASPGRDSRSSEAELQASADRELDPMLVPRRHRPQVIEPEAGDVNGAVAPPEPVPERPPSGGDEEDTGPAPGAPSDAEVRSQLRRLESVSRRYRYDELDFSGQLIPFDALPTDGWRQSVASVFYDFDQGLACGGVLRPEQLGVAHKTAPCGTLVTFRYGDRAIRVPVIDRGPYIVGREWDLTPATAAALGFPGLGFLDWRVSKLG